MVVILFSLRICFKFTCISSLKFSSIFDNGSSKSNKSGLEITALVNDALWASPALI